MQKWLQKSSVFVPLLALLTLWGAGIVRRGWALPLNGNRAGFIAAGGSLSFIVGVRWGWPSRDWIGREHLRAYGNGSHISEPAGTAGFGVLRGSVTWYGNTNITVWHVAVAVPWWYLGLLAAAAPAARWIWSTPPSERQRLGGTCPACGCDVRATPDRCPECGQAPEAEA